MRGFLWLVVVVYFLSSEQVAMLLLRTLELNALRFMASAPINKKCPKGNGNMWVLDLKLDNKPMDEKTSRNSGYGWRQGSRGGNWRLGHITADDKQLRTYSCQTFDENLLAAKVNQWLEAYAYNMNAVLNLVLIGTSIVIGDGILTPAISGLAGGGTGWRVVQYGMDMYHAVPRHTKTGRALEREGGWRDHHEQPGGRCRRYSQEFSELKRGRTLDFSEPGRGTELNV